MYLLSFRGRFLSHDSFCLSFSLCLHLCEGVSFLLQHSHIPPSSFYFASKTEKRGKFCPRYLHTYSTEVHIYVLHSVVADLWRKTCRRKEAGNPPGKQKSNQAKQKPPVTGEAHTMYCTGRYCICICIS